MSSEAPQFVFSPGYGYFLIESSSFRAYKGEKAGEALPAQERTVAKGSAFSLQASWLDVVTAGMSAHSTVSPEACGAPM